MAKDINYFKMNIRQKWSPAGILPILPLLTLGCFLLLNLNTAAQPLLIRFDTQSPSCYGYSDGALSVVATGGLPPYTYNWSNGQTTSNISGVGAGSYAVTVIDAIGMSVSDVVDLLQPDPLFAIISPENSICDGSQGNFVATVSGGTPPYRYTWSNSDRDSILETPPAGFYMLIVNDKNGCKAQVPLVVHDPLSVRVKTIDVICAEICDGSAEAQVIGGVAPYHFQWNWNNDTNQILPWLPAGYYEVTVTDGNGCTAVAGDTIHAPDSIFIHLQVGYTDCGPGAPATAAVNPTGGTPPYSIEWDNGDRTNSTTFLSAGIHRVTITDANHCKVDTIFSTNPTGDPDVTATMTEVSCPGSSDGSVSAFATGGTPPYTFLWNTGDSTQNISGVSEGVYWVKITDINGCMDSDTVIVGSKDGLNLLLSSTPISCFGQENGTAEVQPLTGSSPYQYLWNTGATDSLIGNLPAGIYLVTVTDVRNCIGVDSVLVAPADSFHVFTTADSSICGMNGRAYLSAISGGVAPYTYLWNDSNAQTTDTATNLSPGFYILLVTDSLGCTATDSVKVNDSGDVMPGFGWTILQCISNDSMLVAFSDSSTGVIQDWHWDFGDGQVSTEQNPRIILTRDSNLVKLVVQTTEGCLDSITRLVVLPFIEIDIRLSHDPDSICTDDNFSIQVINLNPADTLTCLWWPDTLLLTGQGTSQVTLQTALAGNFTLYLEKANQLGCRDTFEIPFTITEKRPCLDPGLVTYSQCDSFLVNFTYSGQDDFCWDFGDPNNPGVLVNQQVTTYMYPDTGQYIVKLIPKDICCDTLIYPIYVGPTPRADFDCTYDPCNDTLFISFTDQSSIFKNISSWRWYFSNGDSSSLQNPQITIREAITLQTTLIVDFETGCSDTITKIKDLKPFFCFPDTMVVACEGIPTPLNPGSNPDTTYRYSWSPGVFLSDSTIFNPIASVQETTVFQVTIQRDSCEKVVEVTVFVPPPIQLFLQGDTAICDDREVEVIVSSPQAVRFDWSDEIGFDTTFATGDSISIVPGRPRTIYVKGTDSFGCMAIDSFTTGNYTFELIASPDTIICLGESLTLTALGQHPSDLLSYDWSPDASIIAGDSTAIIVVSPQAETTFAVAAENQFGCRATDSVTVTVVNLDDLLAISADPDTLYVGVPPDFSQLGVTFNPQYSYQWEPCNFLDDPCDIADPRAVPGNISRVFSVTVTDENGCIGERSILVTVLDPPCAQAVFLPNAFTPNGDGKNDILFVRGPTVDELYLAIFNRWGEKVFETTDQGRGWDGTHGGKAVDPDVYGYYLRVKCGNNDTEFRKGNITVLK